MGAGDALINVHGDLAYTHVTPAMDASRRIAYSVLDAAKGEPDAAYTADGPAEPPFKRKVTGVGHGIAGAAAMPTAKPGGRIEAGAPPGPSENLTGAVTCAGARSVDCNEADQVVHSVPAPAARKGDAHREHRQQRRTHPAPGCGLIGKELTSCTTRT
ncbi:hypothetical protein [Nonomuraea sp. NPDC001023]|uniref:hypothetical protein n=1 Tax=unclassified Nonomuraea TaxID=2593643 RepID=UPI0033192C88